LTRRLAFLLPAALFAVLLVVFAVGLRHDPHLLPSALIDRPAPEFALPGLYDAAEGLSPKTSAAGRPWSTSSPHGVYPAVRSTPS